MSVTVHPGGYFYAEVVGLTVEEKNQWYTNKELYETMVARPFIYSASASRSRIIR